METNREHFAHILWKYGQSIGSLRYTVGRESSLPCSKSSIRKCLLTAIGLSHDVNTREQLCAGYVQLEVFITDAEFEIVRESQDRLGEASALLPPNGLFPHDVRPMALLTEETETPASAILQRIAQQMRARRRELWGNR